MRKVKFQTYVLYVMFTLSLSIPLAIHQHYHYSAERLHLQSELETAGSKVQQMRTDIIHLKRIIKRLQKESPTQEVGLSETSLMIVD